MIAAIEARPTNPNPSNTDDAEHHRRDAQALRRHGWVCVLALRIRGLSVGRLCGGGLCSVSALAGLQVGRRRRVGWSLVTSSGCRVAGSRRSIRVGARRITGVCGGRRNGRRGCRNSGGRCCRLRLDGRHRALRALHAGWRGRWRRGRRVVGSHAVSVATRRSPRLCRYPYVSVYCQMYTPVNNAKAAKIATTIQTRMPRYPRITPMIASTYPCSPVRLICESAM